MADTATINQAGLVQANTDKYAGATVRIRLLTGTNITETSVIGNIAANEISGNGYPAGGMSLTYDTTVWDATDSRSETTFQRATLTPSGGNLSWDQFVVTVNNGIEYIDAIYGYNIGNEPTAFDGIPYFFDIKLNTGKQGTIVEIVDN